jgi:hypothetical protein
VSAVFEAAGRHSWCIFLEAPPFTKYPSFLAHSVEMAKTGSPGSRSFAISTAIADIHGLVGQLGSEATREP